MDHKDTVTERSTTDESTESSFESSASCGPRLPYDLGVTAALLAGDVAPYPFLTSLKFASLSSLNGSEHIQALEQTLGLIDSILHPHHDHHCLEMMSLTADPLLSSVDLERAGSLSASNDARPKSFLHDEMYEFNQIFSELVASPQRRFPFRDTGLALVSPASPPPSTPPPPSASEAKDTKGSSPPIVASIIPTATKDEGSVSSPHGLLRVKVTSPGVEGHGLTSNAATTGSVPSVDETLPEGNQRIGSEPVSCIIPESDKGDEDDVVAELRDVTTDARKHSSPRRHSDGGCATIAEVSSKASSSSSSSTSSSSLIGRTSKAFGSLDALRCRGHLEVGGKLCDPMNEDDADSGYMTGDSSVLALVTAAKKLEGVAMTMSRDELAQRIEQFNLNRHGLVMSLPPDSNVFQGNIRVHMNLYRPIKMSLSSRPSSIYDILIRTDARLPENESSVASFRLPNNTFKAIHVTSETTTNLVIKTLLNKFNITDNPKRFALYERIIASQEDIDAKDVGPLPLSNTLSSVRRLADEDRPLELCLRWADRGLDLLDRCQFVLQENDPGEIMWEAFSLPELSNFLRILAKEELSYAEQIRTKYRLLKREMERKMRCLDDEKKTKKTS